MAAKKKDKEKETSKGKKADKPRDEKAPPPKAGKKRAPAKIKLPAQPAAAGEVVSPALGDAPAAEPATKPPERAAVKRRAAKPAAKAKRAAAPREAAPAAPASRPEGARRILVIAAECAPFAKTGGLADAVAGLSKALAARGHDVRVVLPLYAQVDYAKHGLKFDRSACVHFGGGEENWVGVHIGRLGGRVPVWLIDHGRYFMRPGIYHENGGDYTDNAFRYGLLCKAALQVCKDYHFRPDIVHLHDWAAAPAAAFLKSWDRYDSPLSPAASVLTIHNIGHQGVYHAGAMAYYGLGGEHFTADRFEDHGQINLLKAGIHYADAITTVSPSHAAEIAEPAGGKGLAPFLAKRRDDLFGILNGVDDEHWHPETDEHLPARFSAENLSGKAVCKRALQVRCGLEVSPDVPLFGIVSRFAPQKGFELLHESLPRALGDMRFQLVVLGAGDPNTENFFNWLHTVFRERVGVYIGFHDELCHLIEAGSDFFLMPSLYEPCGLNQIYSMAYGTLPVVRATGGLDDTVENYDPATGEGTGFKFWDPTADAVYGTLRWAVDTYYHRPDHIRKLQQAAMAKRFPWSAAAEAYEPVYARAIENRKRWN